MADDLPTAITLIALIILSILSSFLSLILDHWMAITFGILCLCLIFFLGSRIITLNDRVFLLETRNISIINGVIDDRYANILAYIYDEEDYIGYERTHHNIDEGHWAVSIYNSKTRKYIVKHFRTHINLQSSNISQRLIDDINFNIKYIHSQKDDTSNTDGMEKKNGIFVPKHK
jgi:hypothetical protein